MRGEVWVLSLWHGLGFGCSRGDCTAILGTSRGRALRAVQNPSLPSRPGSAWCPCGAKEQLEPRAAAARETPE